MKAREWLAKQGLAQAGKRGRLSRDAHAALEKARRDGMVFDDDKTKVVTVKRGRTTVTKVVEVQRDASLDEINSPTATDPAQIVADIRAGKRARPAHGKTRNLTEPIFVSRGDVTMAMFVCCRCSNATSCCDCELPVPREGWTIIPKSRKHLQTASF